MISVCSLKTRNNEATASIYATEGFEGSYMGPAKPSFVCWIIYYNLYACSAQSAHL
jgi:hypothetical protein